MNKKDILIGFIIGILTSLLGTLFLSYIYLRHLTLHLESKPLDNMAIWAKSLLWAQF